MSCKSLLVALAMVGSTVDAAKAPVRASPLSASTIRRTVLCTLAVQNACQMLSMRYSRLPDQPKYLASTAVLLAEVVKILVSVAVLALQQGVPGACNTIWQGVFVNWRDTLLVGARHLRHAFDKRL